MYNREATCHTLLVVGHMPMLIFLNRHTRAGVDQWMVFHSFPVLFDFHFPNDCCKVKLKRNGNEAFPSVAQLVNKHILNGPAGSWGALVSQCFYSSFLSSLGNCIHLNAVFRTVSVAGTVL